MCTKIEDPPTHSLTADQSLSSASSTSFPLPYKLLTELVTSQSHHESIVHKALCTLLALCTSPRDSVKCTAIKLVSPDLYKIEKFHKVIEDFAIENFRKMQNFSGEEAEDPIKCATTLLFRLIAESPALLSNIFDAFGCVRDNCQRHLMERCKALFRSYISPTNPELHRQFLRVTKDSLPLLHTFVEIYKIRPMPGPMKQTIIEIATRLPAFSLLLPLLPQLSVTEIEEHNLLISIAICETPNRKDLIYGIASLYCKMTDYTEKLKEMLIKLLKYDLQVESKIWKYLAESIDACIEKRDLFALSSVVLPAMTDLVHEQKVPNLLPRTLITLAEWYPKNIVDFMNLVRVLIDKKIWESRNHWFGIERFLRSNLAYAQEVIAKLPEKIKAGFING